MTKWEEVTHELDFATVDLSDHGYYIGSYKKIGKEGRPEGRLSLSISKSEK